MAFLVGLSLEAVGAATIFVGRDGSGTAICIAVGSSFILVGLTGYATTDLAARLLSVVGLSAGPSAVRAFGGPPGRCGPQKKTRPSHPADRARKTPG